MSEKYGQPVRDHPGNDSGEFPLPDSGGRGVTLSEYDALADLFLTGGEVMATPEDRSWGVPSVRAASSGGRMSGCETVSTPGGGATRDERTLADGRELLGACRIETIVVGHLPVLAAVWVGQYARRLSEILGTPVALLRLHAGQCSLELTGELSPQQAGELASRASRGLTIEQAIELASKHTRAWLLRADEPEEVSLAEHANVTDVTLLTGADDMALVATYRTLKALATRVSEGAAAGVCESVVNLRIAILGATPEKAAAAESKLGRTASTFLGRAVTILNAGQRIGSAPTVTLYRANSTLPVSTIFEAIGRTSPPQESPAFDDARSRLGPAKSGGVLSVVEPKAMDSNAIRVPEDMPALFDGMRALPTRCPYAPDVQFGLDTKGRLHLFAMPECDQGIRELKPDASFMGGSPSAPSSGSPAAAQALAKLIAASGWAFDHIHLLRLASPGVTINSDASDTTLHLLTSEPKGTRRLLDSGVLVHAVLPATVGETTTWVVRDLN